MTNGTALPGASARGSGMTMRVYSVDRYGTISQDRGTVTVTYGNQLSPEPVMSTAFPPCECSRCLSGRAVRR
ncbi:hypothetical protein [Streptomyces sp. NPDC002676]